jgi:hypothetical protein
VSIVPGELVDLGLDVGTGDLGVVLDLFGFDFVVEVADVADDGVVLHLGHVLGPDDALIAGGGDVDVDLVEAFLDGDHLVAFHARLKSADGVDLGDVNASSRSLHGLGASLSDVSETADEDLLAGDHHVGGSVEAVNEGVLAAVDVVELGLGDRVVDINEGADELAFLLELVESGHTSGSLLRNTLQVLGQFGEVFLVLLEGSVDGLQQPVLVLRQLLSGGLDQLAGFLELLLNSQTFDEVDSGITSVVDDQVGSFTVPVEAVVGEVPVLLDGFSLPGENGCGLGFSDGRGGVVLGGVDVA